MIVFLRIRVVIAVAVVVDVVCNVNSTFGTLLLPLLPLLPVFLKRWGALMVTTIFCAPCGSRSGKLPMICGMLNEIRCAISNSKKLMERVADFLHKSKVNLEVLNIVTYWSPEPLSLKPPGAGFWDW